MAKTKEELEQLKQEFESLTTKLNELDEDELKDIVSGFSGIEASDFKGKFKYIINSVNGMPEKREDEKYVLK